MFPTIHAGVEAYETELRKYVNWTNQLKLMHGSHFNPMAHLSNQEYAQLNVWGARLKGMEEALGLTEQEILIIGARNGVSKAA